MLLFYLFNTSLQSIFNSLCFVVVAKPPCFPQNKPRPMMWITVSWDYCHTGGKIETETTCWCGLWNLWNKKNTVCFVLFHAWENKEKKPGVPFSLSTVGSLGVARSSFTATINLCPGLKIRTVTAIWQQKGYRHDDNSVNADWGKALNVVHLSAQWCWYSYRLYMSCIRVARFPKEIVSRCSEAVSMWGW